MTPFPIRQNPPNTSKLNTETLRQFSLSECSTIPQATQLSDRFLGKNCSPSVDTLFPFCGPSAIFGTVISIIVLAINGMSRAWRTAHVFEKVKKRIAPSLANFYPASTPISILRIVGIATAFYHIAPRYIFFTRPSVIATPFAMNRFGSWFHGNILSQIMGDSNTHYSGVYSNRLY